MRPTKRLTPFLFFAVILFFLAPPAISQQLYEADNGLTASGSGATRKVSLGGTLTNNTTIPFNGFNLNFTGTGNIGIRTATPLSPLHVYKNVSGNYNPVLTLEDGLTDGFVMFQMRGTNKRYNFGLGNGTWFDLQNDFFIWDDNNAVARFVVSSAGNIGIGVNDPANRLSIAGQSAGTSGLQFTQLNNTSTAVAGNGKVLGLDASGNVILVTDAGAGTAWGTTGNSGTTPGTDFIGTTDNQRLVFKTNNTEVATILGNGNLGIGTNNPTTKLHLNGDFTLSHPTFSGSLTVHMLQNNVIRFVSSQIGEFMRVGLGNVISFHDQQIRAAIRGGYFSNTLGGNSLETVSGNVILNATSGNTLIGTTTDGGQKLQVNGSIRFAGLSNNDALTRVLATDANGNVSWRDAATLGGSTTDAWVYGGNSVQATSTIGNTSEHDLQILTNNVARITVDGTTGNVGIGTTSMGAGYKLYVEEGIRTRKVKVDAQSWADYVFSPSYPLRPLSEVEKYIKEHGHLPEVPSEKEVKENGVDLGDNQALLLKKIEEITLYTIQLHKQLEEMKQEIEKLKAEGKR